jgi:hypothetical protein
MKYSIAQSSKKPPEKPAEKVPEKPQEKPSERPLEKPLEKPLEQPPQRLSAKKPPPKRPHAETYEDIVSRVSAGGMLDQAPKPNSETKPDTEPAPKRRSGRVFAGWLRGAAGLGLFAAGVLFIAFTAHRVDRQMRDAILLEAKIVAQAIEVTDLAALSGTADDLTSPNYERLKEQLSQIRKADKKCRFIYLMGRRPNGVIFFFVDSEDPASPDYSPPGEIYDEATDDDRRVFTTATGNANGGPYTDRWGVWISAMTPVFQPDTNRMLAVLGMDFNATSWKLDVANKSVIPALPAAIAFLFGFYFIVSAPRTRWS